VAHSSIVLWPMMMMIQVLLLLLALYSIDWQP
jgi:hypothetical protein